MIRLTECKESDLTDNVMSEIIALNNRYFKISQDHFKRLLNDKDLIHLYYDNNKLIGILSFKWVVVENKIFLYIGTVVVDDNYQKKGLLSNSLFKCIVFTYRHYFFKEKYAIAFATSPQAYQYFTVLREYWPRVNEQTPQYIIDVIASYLKASDITKYYLRDSAYVISELENRIYEINPKVINNKKIMTYFESLIPKSTKGLQIFCIVPFNLKNFLMIIFRYFSKKISTSKVKFFCSRKHL